MYFDRWFPDAETPIGVIFWKAFKQTISGTG